MLVFLEEGFTKSVGDKLTGGVLTCRYVVAGAGLSPRPSGYEPDW